MADVSRMLVVDSSRHAHDTIDGETVIIDTTSGVLTMLLGFGPTLWESAVAGVEHEALITAVAERYGAAAAAATTTFVDELLAAELLTAVTGAFDRDRDGPGDRDDDGSVGLALPAASWPERFEEPRLETYAELSDIMTMDPIHQVDVSRGWPHRPVADAG